VFLNAVLSVNVAVVPQALDLIKMSFQLHDDLSYMETT